ncbi:MAG: GDP-mannose 4,6-dehydratase, partial [Thermovirgaceae bacterium]
LQVDIRNLDELRNNLSGQSFDIIVHLAARAGVRQSISDPITCSEVNVNGTLNLLEMAKEKKVQQFVFASSSSVYGINPNVPWKEDDNGLLPISPYASTKISGELLGHVYSHLYGMRFLALRLFTVYGPRQRPDLAIHKFARLMKERKAIPIYGDGSTSRDYTFVGDIVKGLAAAMDYSGSDYEVINIGNSHTVSLSEMIETLEDVLQIKAIREERSLIAGDVSQTWADVTKSEKLLGFSPRTTLKEGVKAFIDSLQAAGE